MSRIFLKCGIRANADWFIFIWSQGPVPRIRTCTLALEKFSVNPIWRLTPDSFLFLFTSSHRGGRKIIRKKVCSWIYYFKILFHEHLEARLERFILLYRIRSLTNRFHFECVCSVIDRRWRQNVVRTKKVAHEPLGTWVTDVLTTFWRLLWSITEQTYGKNGIYLFYTITKF